MRAASGHVNGGYGVVGAGLVNTQEKEMNMQKDDSITRDELDKVLDSMSPARPLDADAIFAAREKLPAFTLELTKAEAETLAVVLARISGSSSTTARSYTDSTLRKLTDLGLSWYKLEKLSKYASVGNIRFTEAE